MAVSIKLLKAYLAHSSCDKAYVDGIANRLGRAQIIYDKMCFKPGGDLRDLIHEGLDKSRLFVFFASKHSLDSTYVKYEITEADWQILRGEMGGAITIIIDKDVKVGQLPQWMQRTLVATTEAPAQAARIIRRHLLEESGLGKQTPFIGRERDLEEFARKLITPPEEKPHRIIIVSGLDGVGRRTFTHRALQDYLSLETGPILMLEETASLDKLHWQLLDDTMEPSSRSEVAKALAAFRELSQPEQGEEIARLMAIIAKNNMAPVIVDQKALLDDYGRYLNGFIYVLNALDNFKDIYLVLIHNRRPDLSVMPDEIPGIAFHRLNPLKLEDTELLLRQNFRTANLDASNDQIKMLALYMGGYPPTIELATTYSKFYGVETLIADRSILTDFKVRTFSPMLQKLNLEEREWKLLRMLAGEPALPLEVPAEVLGIQREECAQVLRNLIDLNLVIPVEHNFIISPPIREAVNQTYGPLTKSDYKTIAIKLCEVFWQDPNIVPPLGIIDATIHSLARSNTRLLVRFRDLILPSQLYKAAKEEYDSKNWDEAIKLAKRTLQLDPNRDGARVILFKSWVRKEQWREAERVLIKLEGKRVRAQFYCRGFMEWKRGNLKPAISAFQSALDAGDRSLGAYRDLAHCLFRLGETNKAKRILGKAPERAFRNSYVLDLATQIAVAEKDWKAAEHYLSDLQHIATPEDYHYRRATFLSARHQLPEALLDAEISCKGGRFEASAQRADILIELNHFPEAESAINDLTPISVMKRDVKSGLQIKLLLRQDKWREAEVLWQGLHQQELPVQQAMKKEILSQKVADKMTSPVDRKEALAELEQIGAPIQLPLVVSEEE